MIRLLPWSPLLKFRFQCDGVRWYDARALVTLDVAAGNAMTRNKFFIKRLLRSHRRKGRRARARVTTSILYTTECNRTVPVTRVITEFLYCSKYCSNTNRLNIYLACDCVLIAHLRSEIRTTQIQRTGLIASFHIALVCNLRKIDSDHVEHLWLLRQS